MVKVEETTQGVLDKISEGFAQKGAFNLRQNGISICHGDSEHIKIKKKEDKPGIDIFIDGETKGEKVFIPVVVSVSGMTDLVYNDFYVADGADVDIVAGCGIHNSGCNDSRHDGIHTFHVGKNANVHYEEKHYGEGNGTGSRVLNPVTNIELGENSVFTLDTVQIKGVDSTVRTTNVSMDADSKLFVLERLMTDGEQKAESDIEVCMNGAGSSAQIISRSVGKGNSPRFSIRRLLERTNVTHISSVIPLLWITQRWVLSRKSRRSMWMLQLFMRPLLEELTMSSF